MKLFDSFYNMKVGIVDLTKLSFETISLDKKIAAEKIGGAAVNEDLFKQYEDDVPLVIGVGPLTGSFAPASCLAVATFASPRFGGNICHVPLMMRTGPEMKFSGIDFLAIKGTAPSPQIVHIDRGNIRILSAEHLIGLDIPEILQKLNKEMTSSRSILLTGPSADKGASSASVSIGFSGSLDKAGLALLMASKNLKGIVFNGTDGLSFIEDNLKHNETIEKRLFAEEGHKNEGFLSMLDKIGIEENLRGVIKKAKCRNMACYHCPSPCMSSVQFKWYDPRKNARVEDNILLSDHMGFLALAKKKGKDIFPLSKSCHRFGLDPVAVADRLPESLSLPESLNAIEEISVTPEIRPELHQSEEIYNLFGGGLPPILPDELRKKRIGISMILGVCPIFLLRFPQISELDLLEFLTNNEPDLEFLEKEIQSILGE